MKPVRAYDTKKHKVVVVGYIEDEIFYKKVSTKHFCYKYKGYGMQEEVFPQIKNCKLIIIHAPNGKYLSSPIQWEFAKKDDLGNGLQHFLPVDKMTFHENRNPKQKELL